MRGRTPRPLTLGPADRAALERLARGRTAPWFAVQRARILLGIASGGRVGAVAAQARCDGATVWRVCRRYERWGMRSVMELASPRRERASETRPAAVESVAGAA